MAKSDQVEKRILLVDGEELEGLVQLGEAPIQDGEVAVPGRDKIVTVRNGVKTIPGVDAIYKVTRDSKTMKFLQDWYDKNQVHECTIVRTDGSGQEFGRELWLNVELSKSHAPAYDAASPIFAQQLVRFLPEDIIPIDPEG